MTLGQFVRGGHGRDLGRVIAAALSLATFLTVPAAEVSAAVDRISLPELDFTTGWPVAGLLSLLVLMIALWSLVRGRIAPSGGRTCCCWITHAS